MTAFSRRDSVEALAKEYTQEAFDKLIALVGSDNPKIALEAVTQVLDRGHGGVVSCVAIAQVGSTQGSLKDADMATLMGVLESRIGPDLGQGMDESLYLEGECHELNGPDNRQGDDE